MSNPPPGEMPKPAIEILSQWPLKVRFEDRTVTLGSAQLTVADLRHAAAEADRRAQRDAFEARMRTALADALEAEQHAAAAAAAERRRLKAAATRARRKDPFGFVQTLRRAEEHRRREGRP